jgi:crossover junction endodeoxyribonuclease RuvC
MRSENMDNRVLGIDPGLTGAIAVVGEEMCWAVVDLPVSERTSGKGKQVNAALFADMVEELMPRYGPRHAYLEQVGARPGQGVTSMFTFGRSLGVIEGVLGALQFKVYYVTPARWKRHHGLVHKDKDACRTMAMQRYPEARELLQRKKDVGRADAIMIAAYGESLR